MIINNMVLVVKKIVFLFAALLVAGVTLAAQQKPTDQEKPQPSEQEMAMVQRISELQMSGSDSDFYEAQQTYMDYLERCQEWEKYYRTWMNRVIMK